MSLFCQHKWKEKERMNAQRVSIWDDDDEREFIPNCIVIVLECIKCGKLKKVSVP